MDTYNNIIHIYLYNCPFSSWHHFKSFTWIKSLSSFLCDHYIHMLYMVYSWKYYTCTFIRMSMKTCMKIFIMKKHIMFSYTFVYVVVFKEIFVYTNVFECIFVYTYVFECICIHKHLWYLFFDMCKELHDTIMKNINMS